jgi:putative membrane protein
MKSTVYILSIAVLAAAFSSCKNTSDSTAKYTDYTYLTGADLNGLQLIKAGLEGGLTEIKASKLAEHNSQNPQVIGFAKMMIADHMKAGSGLKKIEREKEVGGLDTISLKHEQMIADLSKKQGADFDKAYMEMMVVDHEKAADLFKEGAKDIDGTVQGFAERTFPIIEKHLNAAKEIYASLK